MNDIWITKEGKKIKYKDMTKSHLFNVINLVKNQINEINETLKYPPSSDGELLYISNNMYAQLNEFLEYKEKQLKELEKTYKLK